ncbi:MAG: 23S rRNA (pseudouridine(1915)-N(3))-methyltransferase RlmH [Candidatus Thermoplasmatota archaeon]|jgi:23S rRNA (pseudouridine1915-N3)-methyltransferase|nr:23S rRNA (pseudouridine(1915)-N(3))-methyltransferase RlmH [Candidatus Thermoplasmatota archaeon]
MGRVIVHLDRTPKDRSIAAILGGYQNRVRSRGISVQFSESTDSSKYESELSNLSGQLVLLDQEGVAMTSEEMANWLKSATIDGNTTNIAVGPHDGFSKELKKSASQIISLSQLTLTHEMAAALLMEQLYRASEINRGSPYHRN